MSTVLSQGRFLGRTLWQKRYGVLNLTLTRYGATEELPIHKHRRPYLCLVLGGGFHEVSGTGEQECQFGTVILNVAGTPHQDRFSSDGARCLNVDLEDSVLAPMATRGLLGPVYSSSAHTCRKAHRIASELNESDGLSAFAIQSILLDLLVDTARSVKATQPQAPAWLEEVRSELHRRYAEPLTASLLAAQVDMHPSHLARTFRTHFGTAIGTYLRRLRAEKAHDLLRTTGQPLVDVAASCGFYDQSHLARTIREFYGQTPVTIRCAEHRRNPHPSAQD